MAAHAGTRAVERHHGDLEALVLLADEVIEGISTSLNEIVAVFDAR